jgi:hypothetical protein
MDIHGNISETEMQILAYLHEHAAGYDDNYPFDCDTIKRELAMDDVTFRRAVSFLDQWRLVGLRGEKVRNSQAHNFLLGQIWPTGLGENYVRDVEESPNVGRRITVTVVKEAWGIIKPVAIGVLGIVIGKTIMREAGGM